MTNPLGFVIVAPLAKLSLITAVPIDGGWGSPAKSANGLIAFGVWDVVSQVKDTKARVAAITGVSIYDQSDEWRTKSGWVEPVVVK